MVPSNWAMEAKNKLKNTQALSCSIDETKIVLQYSLMFLSHFNELPNRMFLVQFY